ncbi:MAG: GNAT family N-acetyltransferase [Oscillospiraceae bacterium]|nr:GNAT family N-acetyltransferase [Oscillospiraceae bacterium]
MQFRKVVALKDGRACTVRNGAVQDAQAVLANFVLTHGQTDYLATYPEENSFTLEQEEAFLKRKEEHAREVELVAEVDGVITGTAGLDCVSRAEKMRHRASFGISVDRVWWGLGIGRALTEACIECARAAGYSQLELEVVAENTPALRLYQSVGYVEFGRNPRGFRSRVNGWQETVLMRLELAE